MEPWDQLTDRQRKVYEFIRDKIRNRGYGPTVREIGENFGIRSPNGVMCHLKALEKKGLITRERNMSRAIQLSAEPRGLRLAGRIAAGVLHEAVEQEDRVDFAKMFTPESENLVALEVHGDSMIEDYITEGDYVIVDRRRTPRKGQIVVAVTDEGEATLKRWYPEKGRVRLQPANASMKPIFVKNVEVFGVAVGVVRKVQ